jgi:hypothetical protein
MATVHRRIFFVSGSRKHWQIGKENQIWGFSRGNRNFLSAKADLQEKDFRAGAEIIAISGPDAHFRAVVGSDKDIFYDDETIYWSDPNNINEIYPIRFKLTNIQDINRPWFRDRTPEACLSVLEDVYGVKRRSLYLPDASFYHNANVDLDVVFGTLLPQPEPISPDPEKLEEDYRQRYSRQYHCDDGHDVRSLSEKDIDNWLWTRGIAHAYEPVVTIPEKLIPDFKVRNSRKEDVYIEFWGRENDPLYNVRMQRKRALYPRYHLHLIEIFQEDITNLDFKLSQKLMNKGVVVPY